MVLHVVANAVLEKYVTGVFIWCYRCFKEILQVFSFDVHLVAYTVLAMLQVSYGVTGVFVEC